MTQGKNRVGIDKVVSEVLDKEPRTEAGFTFGEHQKNIYIEEGISGSAVAYYSKLYIFSLYLIFDDVY